MATLALNELILALWRPVSKKRDSKDSKVISKKQFQKFQS